MEQQFYLMFYLAFAQLKGWNLKDIQMEITQQDLEMLYRVCRFHSMTALVYDALLQIPAVTEQEDNRAVLKKFQEAKEKSIRKNLLMDVERARLFAYMDQQGIWYLPLKGVILKELYPKIGERQMADNDILFDANEQKAVHDWFAARGYEVISYGNSNHDVYEKEPVYNFEMHTALYGEVHKEGWEEYYRNVKERLIHRRGMEFEFSIEDFYIYFMSHAFKHYDGSGTGIRFLLDLQVYLAKYQSVMDWEYVTEEIRKLGMTDFEADSKALLEVLEQSMERISKEENGLKQWIADMESGNGGKDAERAMFCQLLHSGTYGTMENRVQKTLNRYEEKTLLGKKGRYYVQRLFPDREFMRRNYKPFGDYIMLLPIGWIYRIVRGLIRHPGKLFREAKTVNRVKKTE